MFHSLFLCLAALLAWFTQSKRLIFLQVVPSPTQPHEPETPKELVAWWLDLEHSTAKEAVDGLLSR